MHAPWKRFPALGSKRREARGRPLGSPRAAALADASTDSIYPMADRSLLERELAEIGTQLSWVRDYL
jgi:hypothetical protein